MELKKSKKADLEGKKAIFLEIGLIVALGIVIIAFSLSQSERTIEEIEFGGDIENVDLVDITTEQQPETPPVQQQARVITNIIEVVTNNRNIETNLDFTDYGEDDVVVAPVVVENEEIVEETIFLIADKMPSFRGGDLNTFRNWVLQRLRYPEEARNYGIQGTVTLTFVVEKNGNVTNIQALNSPDKMLTEEAIRVVTQSPEWEPGRQRDLPVRIRYNLPIVFSLQN